nr:putative ribonuclease H-like domain-containing protein [Tanacetum cinerariifolium]
LLVLISTLALIAEKMKVSKSKEKVVVSSDSEGSEAYNFSKLKKITALLAKVFNRRKFYSKTTNNNLRTSSTSQSVNKKQEFVKTNNKNVEKKDDKKKRDMSRVKYASSSSVDEKIFEVLKDQLQVKHVVIDTHVECQEKYVKLEVIEKNNDLLAQTKVLKDQLQVKHVVIDTHVECQEKYAKLEAERYEYMIRYSAYFDNVKQHRKQIADQEVLYDKMSVQLVELDKHVRDHKNTVLEKDFKISELEERVHNNDLEIEKCLERLNVCENKLHKIGQTNQIVHMIMPSKDNLYNGRKGIGFENPSYFGKAKDLRPTLYDEKVIGLGYTSMFLKHSDEALEIEKFKRTRENKIDFAYDYRNLNASYVNEKINFEDDYFQEIINPDFEKIDSLFQQTSSLKPYVLNVILEKIIIDLEYEVVNLLEKEKVNLETIESLKSKGFESSENVISESENQSENNCHIVQICLWIIDSGCSKHMTGNRALLTKFVEKFLETVCFGNNDFDASSSQSWLWHQRLSHLNFATINNLVKNNLAQGLPKKKFEKDHLCFACEKWKIHRKHHKSKMAFASNKPVYLLHMDLCGPMHVQSINGKQYVLVVVDDYSRYTWVIFLHSKDEASEVIISFIKKTQVNLQLQVQRVRTDKGTEFNNKTLAKFFDEVGITQQFFAARTPQQNGVVERRNRTLVEAARTMLTFANLPSFL